MAMSGCGKSRVWESIPTQYLESPEWGSDSNVNARKVLNSASQPIDVVASAFQGREVPGDEIQAAEHFRVLDVFFGRFLPDESQCASGFQAGAVDLL